jgi:hypothetical protein
MFPVENTIRILLKKVTTGGVVVAAGKCFCRTQCHPWVLIFVILDNQDTCDIVSLR